MKYELKEEVQLGNGVLSNNIAVITNIALFLSGKLVSILGSNIYGFAIGLYVMKVTGSATNFALTMVISVLPRIILGPFAGSIVDKTNRKFWVVGMDILSGFLMIIVYFLSISKGLTLTYIYTSAFFLAIFSTFFSVAIDASVPSLVDDKRLMKISSLSQTVRFLAMIIAPIVGGIIYGIINISVFIVINGISFIVSGISECFINFNLNKKEINKERKSESILRNTLDGLKYLKSQKSIYALIMYGLFINFFIAGIEVVMPFILINHLSFTSSQYGFIGSLSAISAVVFSILLSALPELKNKHKIIWLGTMIFAIINTTIGVSALPMLNHIPKMIFVVCYAIISVSFGALMIFINVPIEVSIQRKTPDEFRGRVFGTMATLSTALTPLSTLLNGILIDSLPIYIAPIISGIMMMVIVIFMVRSKELSTL